ncbi:ClpP [Cynara cardunculus var. scolymus]|uniref:ClpP n=1 Tax=Cynara cardunculus var. scolymus TaxID=59895 RepID=A0A103XZH0_CYNCS|nr:ClpP [Cynara cardunculus var. scolymus]
MNEINRFNGILYPGRTRNYQTVMIHQPAGSFSEVAMGKFILEVTGKPLWVVSEDMERDVFMSATEAQAYEIVDLVAIES